MAYNRSNGGNDGDLSGLIPIFILFCIPTGITQFIAFIMLLDMAKKRNWFRRLRDLIHGTAGQNAQARQGQTGSQDFYTVDWSANGQYASRSGAQAAGQPGAQTAGNTRAASGPAHAKAQKAVPLKKGGKPGLGLIIGGAVTSGIFSIGTFGALFDFVRYGFPDDLAGAFACAVFMLGGLAMLISGVNKNQERDRFSTYLAYIGANREVDLARMAANLDVPVKKLCKDLRKMLAKGILPTGYVDLAEGKLFLTEMGYRAPEKKEEKKAEAEPVRTAEDEDAILKEIRQVNDFIPDEVMSEKIDRIEEITRKILAYQKKHPEKAGQLRSFLNYYLPTTLKILRAYAQLDAQGVEGENISAAKTRIEGMMDQVVFGFEKQLDKLFQADAMDVAADVEVLENMLKKDGLSDGQGMTLTM